MLSEIRMKPGRPARPEVSIVIPVYNEAGNLQALFDRLLAVVERLERRAEIIFVDDGSRDGSIDLLTQFFEQHPALVRVVEFQRNYGQHMAVIAGFQQARGDVVVTLDADLQNPPEEIPKLLDLIDRGHDVVGGYRRARKDSAWRRWPSRIVNGLREVTTGVRMRDQGCMLRAYRREIVERVVETGDSSTYIPALAQFFSRNPAEVEVEHAVRHAGESKYNLYRLVRLNFDLMTGLTTLPLQIFTLIGMIVSGLSFLLVCYLALRRLAIGPEAEGLFTLFAIAFFLMGVMITGIGIVGEYVGRIHLQLRQHGNSRVKHVYEAADEE